MWLSICFRSVCVNSKVWRCDYIIRVSHVYIQTSHVSERFLHVALFIVFSASRSTRVLTQLKLRVMSDRTGTHLTRVCLCLCYLLCWDGGLRAVMFVGHRWWSVSACERLINVRGRWQTYTNVKQVGFKRIRHTLVWFDLIFDSVDLLPCQLVSLQT